MTNSNTKPCTKFRHRQLRKLANDEAHSQVGSFATRDSIRLRYRSFQANDPKERAIILLGRESVQLQTQSQSFVDQRTAVFSIDLSKRSGARNTEVSSLSLQSSDLEDFVRHLSAKWNFSASQILLIGQSDDAVTLAAWVHDYAPKIRGIVLLSPTLGARSATLFATPEAREHCSHRNQTASRVVEDAQAIHCPTLLLQSDQEDLSNARSQLQFFHRLSSKLKQRFVTVSKDDHLEPTGEEHGEVKRFIEFVFEQPTWEPDLTESHQTGYTFDEQQRLLQPLSVFSPKRWTFASQRTFLNTVGRLSKGVQIGWETGFDSGVSLDHVYENTPRGVGFVGRAIDRIYLDSIGWRGIRQRRIHLQRQLSSAITNATDQRNGTIKILDVATGAGRYVLDTIRNHKAADRIEAELRDFHQHNLDQSRRIAQQWHLENVSFVQHDAFAPSSYADNDASFDIAIVSGLYELFPDNDQVTKSLAAIRETLRPGGVLLYTNQPWHPQLELIARVLPSHQGGKSWVMRRRTQAEMDQLVERAGFMKNKMDIDEWGIFTVSTAVAH